MHYYRDDKAQIVAALYAWIAQRPGMDPREYGDRESYLSEARRVRLDGIAARSMVRWAELSSVTAKELHAAMPRSARLSLRNTNRESRGDGWYSPGGWSLEYCTGQYWPTEYRRAVIHAMRGAMREFAFVHCRAKDGEDVRKYMRDSLPGPVFRRIW